MFGERFITSGCKGGEKGVVFHTIRRCKHLEKSDGYRKAKIRELEWHRAKECTDCKQMKEEAIHNAFKFWSQI